MVRFTIKEVLSHHQAKALGPGTALRMEGGGLLEEDEVLPQGPRVACIGRHGGLGGMVVGRHGGLGGMVAQW